MPRLELEGRVFSGEGNGKKYLSLTWVKQQMEQKLGYTPFLGTLNLRLDAKSVKNKKTLQKSSSEKICPPEGYCVGLLYKAKVNNIKCAIILPQVKGYELDVLELVSEVCLRDKLILRDGDAVCVLVQV